MKYLTMLISVLKILLEIRALSTYWNLSQLF